MTMQEKNSRRRFGKLLQMILGIVCAVGFCLSILTVFMFGFFGHYLSFGQNDRIGLRYDVYNLYTTVKGQDGFYYSIINERSAIIKTDRRGNAVWVTESGQLRGSDTFSEANQIYVDDEGNIYLADLEWSAAGFTIARERILKYNKYGMFETEIYCADYTGETIQKPRLMGLSIQEDQSIRFLVTEETQVTVYAVDASDTVHQVQRIPFTGTSGIQDAVLSTKGELYFADKTCRVCRLEADGSISVLTDAAGKKEYFVPYRLSADENGTVYFTDIGNSAIYSVTSEGAVKEYLFFSEEEDILMNVFAIDAHTVLFTTDQRAYQILTDSGTVTEWAQVWNAGYYNTFWNIVFLLQGIFLIGGIAVCVYFLIKLSLHMFRMGLFAKWKLALISTSGILLTSLLILPTILMSFREMYFSSYQNEIYLLSTIAAETVDAELIEEVTYPTDYGTPAYEEMREQMENVINRSYSYGDNIYLNVIRYCNDRAYAVYYLDDSIGGYYPLFGDARELLRTIYETGENGHTADAAEVTGSYTYVVSPIKNDTGEVVGAVEIGMDLNAMQSGIYEIFIDILIGILMLIVVSVFLLNEGISFMQNRSEYQQNTSLQKIPLHELRLITMLCFTALNMPTSFMPVYLESLHTDGLLLNQTQCGTIPLTVNFALMAVMALFCAPIMRKFSFRTVTVAGSAICMAGDLAMSMGIFRAAFLGLVLNGIGLGLLLNSFTICVSSFRTEEDKNKGFAVVTSASLSGMLCGMVIGANLAKYAGESAMFWFSSVFWLAEIILTFTMGRHFTSYAPTAGTAEKGGMRWYQFLLKPSILGFIFFVEFPAAVITCFSSYFVPLFTDSICMNEVRTSLVMILNSLTGAFFTLHF